MVDRIVPALLMVLCWTSSSLAQGPIPPVRVPDQFQGVHDGYDMAVPYQRWRMWVEAQKGPVTEQALGEADALEGRQRTGRPLFTVAFHNDYGRVASGDVRVYCTVLPVYPDRDRGECSYLYRRADVPLSPSYSGEPNVLDIWMRENFDPAMVARNIRAAGVAPDGDLWMVREKMFEGAASPAPMLRENQRIVRVDSRDCPAFQAAVEAVERRRLDWTLDLFAVGEDLPMRAPHPHAGQTFYTLHAWVDGYDVTLTGGPTLATVLGPVIEAVWDCEQGAERSRVRPRP